MRAELSFKRNFREMNLADLIDDPQFGTKYGHLCFI